MYVRQFFADCIYALKMTSESLASIIKQSALKRTVLQLRTASSCPDGPWNVSVLMFL